MTNTAKPSCLESLYDLLVTGAALYPLAVACGVACVTELAARAADYHADGVEKLIVALRGREQGPQILADLAARFKLYLQESGDTTERAVLNFNERLQTTLRQPREATSASAATDGRMAATVQAFADATKRELSKLQQSSAPSNAQALQQALERLVDELRRAEASTAGGRSATV